MLVFALSTSVADTLYLSIFHHQELLPFSNWITGWRHRFRKNNSVTTVFQRFCFSMPVDFPLNPRRVLKIGGMGFSELKTDSFNSRNDQNSKRNTQFLFIYWLSTNTLIRYLLSTTLFFDKCVYSISYIYAANWISLAAAAAVLTLLLEKKENRIALEAAEGTCSPLFDLWWIDRWITISGTTRHDMRIMTCHQLQIFFKRHQVSAVAFLLFAHITTTLLINNSFIFRKLVKDKTARHPYTSVHQLIEHKWFVMVQFRIRSADWNVSQ